MGAELSTTASERARKAHSLVLQAMQDPGTARNIANAIGVSESTVSRTKAGLEDAITLIVHLGFKVVSQDMKCFPVDYVEALHALARRQITERPKLDWDD